MARRAVARSSSAARGAVMVVGTATGAGKSTVVSGLCRALARRGLRVAPFKARTTTAHTTVTPDGGQVSRAQAFQALAARTVPDRRMGPVLVRPGAGGSADLVVLGEEVADGAGGGPDGPDGYAAGSPLVRSLVLDTLTSLRADHDVVVLEGAGGAAETPRLDGDVVNLPLAAAAGLPAVLVTDVERGSVAAAYGTWALLPERLRRQLRGFVLNCHRGDRALLADGLADLEQRTGVPVLGVLPHLGEHLMLGVEDSVDLIGARRPVGRGKDPVRVAVVRLPHLSTPSDLDALVLEPSVELRWVTRPGEVADCDLVILPGSRATVADLRWLRDRGLDRALTGLDRRVRLFGVGAGYQMLGGVIHDDLESGAGTVEGLGLLPVETELARPRIVTRSRGHVVGTEIPVEGYQIRWGRVRRLGGLPLFTLDGEGQDGTPVQEGCVAERHIRGTSLHGSLECDRLRHALLWKVAAARGRSFAPSPVPFHTALDTHVEHLADWVEEHLDVEALLALASEAAAPGQEPGW